MAEVLGVLASAVQLAQCALQINAAISTIHTRVRDTSELTEWAAQIKQLITTSISIQQDRRFHNSSVLRHLNSTIAEAEKLLGLLGRVIVDYTSGSLSKRYFKAAKGGKEEKKIANGFRRLEQEKISLILCIGIANAENLSLNTERLSCIQKGVGKLVGNMSDVKQVESLSKSQRVEAVPSRNSGGLLDIYQHKCETITHATYKEADGFPNPETSTKPHPGDRQDRAQPNMPDSDEIDNIYEECYSHTGGKQHNGNFSDGVCKIEGKNRYNKCIATTKGKQINGNVYGSTALATFSEFFKD